MVKVVDNRKTKQGRVGFGDVVITEDERRYLAIDISLHNDKECLGFIELEEGYLSRTTNGDYQPKYIDGKKIVDIIKSKNIELALGE